MMALSPSYTMSVADSLPTPVPKLNRNIVIAASVVLFHVAALWALQSGLLRRAVEIVVPVAILSEIVNPPAPKAEPPAPPQPKPAEPVKQAAPRKAETPVRKPAAIPDPRPAIAAPSSVELQMSPPVAAAPAEAPPAPAREAAPPKIELPSSNASYLQNPPLVYPPMSKRLGEQGKVVVRVLIGADGKPQRAQLKSSSGYDRLDRAALEYVMQCRYVPGRVGTVAEAMWHDAPVNFILE